MIWVESMQEQAAKNRKQMLTSRTARTRGNMCMCNHAMEESRE